MHIAHKFYDCAPRIVRAGRESVITIRPLFDHCRFRDDCAYQVTHSPIGGVDGQTRWVEVPMAPVVPTDGSLSIPFMFESEQEYILLLGQRHYAGEVSVRLILGGRACPPFLSSMEVGND